MVSETSDGSDKLSCVVSVLRAVASNLRSRLVWFTISKGASNYMALSLALVASLGLGRIPWSGGNTVTNAVGRSKAVPGET